jgi:hypothetical protein
MNASPDSNKTNFKLPTPVIAVLVSVAALLAAFAAYKGTTMLISPSADPCQQGKDEVLAIKELAPDYSVLDSRPDLSMRLAKAGELIYNNCQYRDGREFEMANVESWAGYPAQGGATPPASTAPSSEPTTVPTTAPTTESTIEPSTDTATTGG